MSAAVSAAPVVETGACVRETVRLLRAAGLSSAAAIAEAARRLDLSERRVRAYQYGEVCTVLAAEYLGVRDRFRDYLAREEARLQAQAAVLAARRRAMDEPT